MPQRLLAPAATATLLFLTTNLGLAQTSTGAPGSVNAEQGWSRVTRCAQEDTERARHACLDRVLREAGLLTDEMHAKQQRRAFGLDDKPARTTTAPAAEKPSIAGRLGEAASAPVPSRPATEGSAPTTPPPPVVPAASSAPSAQPDRLDVELAKVGKAVNGRMLVTTTDGAVWVQTESVEMPQPPVAGDHMTIRKGSMGGYRCSVVSTNLTYRCARNK
jgi:hypothetical protein